jgi:tRNA(fMet)-specific endonuclease VapC
MSSSADVKPFRGEETVNQALIDTDILSLFFRAEAQVVSHFEAYTAEYSQINISILTYYEILSGLKHRNAASQLASFVDFAAACSVVPLTPQSVSLSADLYASLRAQGTPLDDIDLLIAGIALDNDWVLVTHNRRHFDRIPGLEIEDWTQV